MSRRSNRSVVVIALLAGLAAGGVVLGHQVVAEADRYLNVDSDYAFLLVPLRWCAVAVGMLALCLGFATRRRWSDGESIPLTSLLRGGLYSALLAFAAGSFSLAIGGVEWTRFATRSVFFSVLLLCVSGWTIVVALLPAGPLRARPRALRIVDVVLINLVAVLVLSELGLGLYARLRPSQILWDEASVESYVESRRMKPGVLHKGFRANSRGFYDHEFFRPGEQDFVVALLSDSFGLGVVSYEFNYVRVAERRLAAALARPGRRVAIHNFSVTGIDVSGYAWLLENEVMQTEPSTVVLAIFVGNDITGFEQHRTRYYGLQYLRLYKTLSRLLALHREVAAGGHIQEVGISDAEGDVNPPAGEDEVPTLSERAFLGLELERLERCLPERSQTQKKFRGFFEALDYFHRRLGDRLLVVLIPDEYQVNDELYAALMEQVPDPGDYDRYYPQKRIGDFCREKGIELLDLVEPLRAAQQRGRVYHLRDSHWNADGNRVGGEALAEALLSRFSDRIPDGGADPPPHEGREPEVLPPQSGTTAPRTDPAPTDRSDA